MKRLKNSLDKLIYREGNSANNWTLGLEESFKEIHFRSLEYR